MSTRLSTLLYLNGQFQAVNHRNPPRQSLPPNTHEAHPVQRCRSPTARIFRSLLSGLIAIVATSALVLFVLGFQQIDHVRERVRWSRQLQEREQEINRLARERQILQGLMAVKTMDLAKPDLLPAAYAGTPPPPRIKKHSL